MLLLSPISLSTKSSYSRSTLHTESGPIASCRENQGAHPESKTEPMIIQEGKSIGKRRLQVHPYECTATDRACLRLVAHGHHSGTAQ